MHIPYIHTVVHSVLVHSISNAVGMSILIFFQFAYCVRLLIWYRFTLLHPFLCSIPTTHTTMCNCGISVYTMWVTFISVSDWFCRCIHAYITWAYSVPFSDISLHSRSGLYFCVDFAKNCILWSLNWFCLVVHFHVSLYTAFLEHMQLHVSAECWSPNLHRC